MKSSSLPWVFRLALLFMTCACLPARGADDDESIPGNPPKLHPGIITCDDGSRWYGFTYQARLGLGYTVESSTDLINWDTVEDVPGGGQQESFLMKAAPPLSVPSIPSSAPHAPFAPLTSAQIVVYPATGGGVVLSWKSLDDGQPMSWYFSDLTLVAGWNTVPLYDRIFDGFFFMLTHPGLTRTPPTENPVVAGTQDTAMLAAFGSHFDDMNADVLASIARNQSPTLTPPVATEHRFWRVRCDWSLDSDGDGTPDWVEYQEMFATAAAIAAGDESASTLADPFLADSNHDGVPDGLQMDSDHDGVADIYDAAPLDPLISWERTPTYRYAFFSTVAPQTTGGTSEGPLGIDNRGGILFDTHQWLGGTMVDLKTTGILSVQAMAVNGPGNIIGTVIKAGANGQGDSAASGVHWWKDALTAPVHIGAANMKIYPDDGSFSQIQSLADSFTDGGRFSAAARQIDPESAVELPARWQIDPVSGATTAAFLSQTPTGFRSWELLHDGNFYWGLNSSGSKLLVRGFHPSDQTQTDEVDPLGFKHLEFVGSTHTGSVFSDGEHAEVRIRDRDGHWQKSTTLPEAVDISKLGLALLPKKAGESAKVWSNASSWSLDHIAPELNTDLAATCVPIDLSSNGCMLVNGGAVPDLGEVYLSGFPITLQGIPTTSGGHADAAGVDTVSASVAVGVSGYQDKLWIMVPNEGTNQVRFLTPACPTAPLSLACSSTTLTPSALQASVADITLGSPAGVTEERKISFTVGTTTTSPAISYPVGIKAMKKRTVKVSIHPVALKNGDAAAIYPTVMPSNSDADKANLKTKVEGKLNDVFGKQVNAFFSVTILDATEKDFDDTSGDLNGIVIKPGEIVVAANPTPEMTKLGVDLTTHAEGAQVDIWVTGGVSFRGANQSNDESPAVGGKKIGGDTQNYCLIRGDLPLGVFLHAVAHEIGHNMTRDGHPNDKSISYNGPRLEGTDQSRRLMCAGENTNFSDPGSQLVKGEWDRIEDWLHLYVDPKNE